MLLRIVRVLTQLTHSAQI